MRKSQFWKKCILILTSVTLALGGIFSYLNMDFDREMPSPATWQAYSPSDQRFDVHFPTDPKESSQELVIANKKIQYHEFSTENEGTHYAVSYLDFPGHWKWLGVNKLLNKSFEGLVKNDKNIESVMSQALTKHQGHPALEYHLKQAGKEVKGRFIVVGNTLYRVALTYPLVASEKVDSATFFDSFQIKR